MLFLMFLYKITRLVQLQLQDYAHPVVFPHSYMNNMSSDSLIPRRIFVFDECFFHVSGLRNNQDICTWDTGIPRMIRKPDTVKMEKSDVLGTPMVWPVPTITIMKKSEESNIIKCRTVTCGQRPKHSYRHNMLFSSGWSFSFHDSLIRSLDEHFPSLCVGTYGPKDCPTRIPDSLPRDFSFRNFWLIRFIALLSLPYHIFKLILETAV